LAGAVPHICGAILDRASKRVVVDSAGKVRTLEGIRVNAVRPGMTYSDIHASVGEPDRVDRVAPTIPLGRGGKAEEIAEAVLWLCSDAATYCTGTIIDVHGGRSL
jgi:NAD(P)-dependent dehydrogenase (short-subunit alcohol dehydrogenase family)